MSNPIEVTTEADGVRRSVIRPLDAMFEDGILWYINRVAFHPRGFALGLMMNDAGEAIGWQVWGNGDEPWSYAGIDENAKFAAVEALFDAVRKEPGSGVSQAC